MNHKKISFSIVFLLFFTVGCSMGLCSPTIDSSKGNFTTPKASDGEIIIITPENKTYTEPDSGYYPATYGFENDLDGSVPDGWVTSSGSVLDSIEVINEINNHKKIVDMNKGNSYGTENQIKQFFGQSQEYGTIEFWVLTSDISEATAFHPMKGTTALCGVGFGDTPDFAVHTLGGWQNIPFAASDNTWYHICLQFECGTAKRYGLEQYYFRVLIDGVSAGEFKYYSNESVADNFMVLQNWPYENYHTYLDAIGYSWNAEYSIGDNLEEGLLLSYNNVTTLEWIGYSLDEFANVTILGNTSIPMPTDGTHYIKIYGNDTIGTIYKTNLRYFSVDTTKYINLLSPENRIYSSPDSGYFAATYGFENDNEGSHPFDWNVGEGGGTVNVVNIFGNHKKIVELHDVNSLRTRMENIFGSIDYGTVELWFRTENSLKDSYIVLHDGTEPPENGDLALYSVKNGFMRVNDEGVTLNIVAFASSNWYHLSIDFECTSGGYKGLGQWEHKIRINGSEFGPYGFINDKKPDRFRIDTSLGDSGIYSYVDAVGYSWDSNYLLGNNVNEGLLLSYDSNINFDWQGYSLDGQANRTILGNTTIPMPLDGIHSIQVFGNDTIGTMYESVLRYFTVNTASPEITINLPTHSQVIGSTAPNYDISIVGLYESIWYSLEGGSNHTANGLAGIIDQTAWSTLSDGIITIDFYANNSAGMIGTAQVMVIKDSSVVEPPPAIPGYNIYVLLGLIGTISALLLGKRIKS